MWPVSQESARGRAALCIIAGGRGQIRASSLSWGVMAGLDETEGVGGTRRGKAKEETRFGEDCWGKPHGSVPRNAGGGLQPRLSTGEGGLDLMEGATPTLQHPALYGGRKAEI